MSFRVGIHLSGVVAPSFKVINEATVAVVVGETSWFGNPEREWSMAREKFMVAVTASIPRRHPLAPPPSPRLSFIIISVLIDS